MSVLASDFLDWLRSDPYNVWCPPYTTDDLEDALEWFDSHPYELYRPENPNPGCALCAHTELDHSGNSCSSGTCSCNASLAEYAS